MPTVLNDKGYLGRSDFGAMDRVIRNEFVHIIYVNKNLYTVNVIN